MEMMESSPSKPQVQSEEGMVSSTSTQQVKERALEQVPSKPRVLEGVDSRASLAPSPSKQMAQEKEKEEMATSQSKQRLLQTQEDRARSPSSTQKPPLSSSNKIASKPRVAESAVDSQPLSKSRTTSQTKKKGAKKTTKKSVKVEETPVEIPAPPKEEPAPPKGPIRFSAPPLLTEFCLRCIIKNFKDHPLILSTAYGIPKRFVSKVVELLPTSLPPEVTAVHLSGPESELYLLVHSANFILILQKLSSLTYYVTMHGSEWKRAYFESMLRFLLEESTKDKSEILNFMDVARDYIFYLNITQLLSHFDLKLIFSHLVNLVGINLSYGARNLGTNFEFDQFGIKPKDCEDLRFALRATHTLSSLSLPNNLIDDNLLKSIVSGLMENYTVTSLDLSHNKIGDEGIKSLCELLENKDCTISHLDVTNNQIGTEGGKFLGKTVLSNSSLEQLTLRRNRLDDQGGVALFDGLKLNNNICSNNLGEESARSLSELIWIKKASLLYVTNNPFGKKGAEQFEGTERNEFILEFDVRNCDLGKSCEDYIATWTRRNEKKHSTNAYDVITTTSTPNSGNGSSKPAAGSNGRPATASSKTSDSQKV